MVGRDRFIQGHCEEGVKNDGGIEGQEVHESLRARAQVTKERRSCRKADQEAEELWESRWTVRL